MTRIRRLLLLLIFVFGANVAVASSQTGADYVIEKETTGNEFVVGCWEKPAIDTSTLPQPEYVHTMSEITLAWLQAHSTCPIAELEYRLQVFSEGDGLSRQVTDTGWGLIATHQMKDLTDGIYYWELQVRDQFENTSTTGPVRFYVDTTAPDVTLSVTNTPFLQEGSKYTVYYPGYALFNITHTDPVESAVVEYRLNNGEWVQGNKFTLGSEPVTTVEYKATDAAGNQSSVRSASIVTDVYAPATAIWTTMEATNTSATLSWYAPPDDNPTGMVSTYDLRYSTDPISEETFGTAKQITAPIPQVAWTTQSAQLLDLTPATTYYVALRSFDMAGNASALSFQTFTTTAEPVQTVPSLNAWVDTTKGEIGFTVENTAGYRSLEYQVTYERSGVADGLQGTIPVESQSSITRTGLTLGTCSTGVCVMHTHIQQLKVKVILREENDSEVLELEQSL